MIEEACRHCGGDAGDNSFDRSYCACGSMHTFHNACGLPLDPCPYDGDVYAEMARLPNRQAAEAFGRVREGMPT